MPVYTTAATTPAAAAGAPYATFHTGANRRAFIREIHYSTQSATFSQIGIVYPNNGPTATTSTTPVAHDTDDATPTCALDTAWGVAPTIAVTPSWLRKHDLGPAQGQILIQTMPLDNEGVITLAKSTFLVFWNFGAAAGSALDIVIVYEE